MDYERPDRPLMGTHAKLTRKYTMIISLAYAKRLIKAGKATIATRCYNSLTGETYWVINRHDLQRTDHAVVNT